MTPKHAWFEVSFSFLSYIECKCGFRPNSQEELDDHAQKWGLA